MLGRRASRLAPPLPTRITLGHGAMRRDGDIAPYRHYTRQIRTRITHRALPMATGRCGAMVGRRASRLAPYRHYTRMECTIENPKNLCASIHPAQTLFVPLCVKTFRAPRHHP